MENQEVNKPQEKLPKNQELKSLAKEELSVGEGYDSAYKGCRIMYCLALLSAFLVVLGIIGYEVTEGLRPIHLMWVGSILFTSPIAFMNAMWARKTFPFICSIIFSVWLAVLLVVIFPPVSFPVLAFLVSKKSASSTGALVFLYLVLGYYFWVFRFLRRLFAFYGKNLGKGISLEQAHCVFEHKKCVKTGTCKCPEHPFYDKFATVFSVCTLLHVLASAAFVYFVVHLFFCFIAELCGMLLPATEVSLPVLLKMLSESTPAS